MRPRLSTAFAATLTFLAVAAMPASATTIKGGVTVTVSPLIVDEGSMVMIDAVYDERGGEPSGSFEFRFGDGATRDVVPTDLDPTFAGSTEHAYGDDGSFTVSVVVSTASDRYKGSRQVTVRDVAPELAPPADVLAGSGAPFELELAFTDPGWADAHRVTVDWGDGAIESFEPAVGERAPTAVHTYAATGGPFPASATIEDIGNGASSTRSFDVTVFSGCGGRQVTIDMVALGVTSIVGTPGDDVILGTPGDDRISAGSGNDTVCAGGGTDIVKGGPGSDNLWGGSGDDVVSGGGGRDAIEGDAGQDELRGGTGNDTINGGDGDDAIRGAGGDDVLRGSRGADRLVGGDGDDVLLGGIGTDRLVASGGNDVLHGGAGTDSLKGGGGTDLLFSSEYPNRDAMKGGRGNDAVGVGRRGTEAAGIRRYATEDEALAFQGSYLLSGFTTYHNCCENRVINIQLMADAVGGHIVMPGEAFSINDVVGRRTEAKGYKPAGAIIGGYVQCCNYAENIGGGTSQFATTFYNAVFFSAMEDLEHQPHTAWFSRYPQGREATMGYPHPDVVFRNNTDHPVLITTHHDGFQGGSIGVKFWGDNGHIEVTAGSEILARYSKIVRWNVNTGLSHCSYPGPAGDQSGSKQVSVGTDGFTVEVYQHIAYPDGGRDTNTTRWRYVGNYEVWEYNPYAPSGGCGGGTAPPPVTPPPGSEPS